MAKSHPVDETEKCRRGRATKRQRRPNAKKRSRKAKGAETANAQEGCRWHSRPYQACDRKQTKQQTCLDLLSRREGATIEELQAATGWQQHSVRGFLAGAVKKKLGLTLLSEKPDAGARRYRISDAV